MTVGPVVAMDLLAEDAVGRWEAMVGPMDPTVAKTERPGSIRASLGTDAIRNVIHSAKSSQHVEKVQTLPVNCFNNIEIASSFVSNSFAVCKNRPTSLLGTF